MNKRSKCNEQLYEKNAGHIRLRHFHISVYNKQGCLTYRCCRETESYGEPLPGKFTLFTRRSLSGGK